MINQKLNETDIAGLRAAILTLAGERLIDYICSQNPPVYEPDQIQDANKIAFKAAYSQGYEDALKCLIDTLTPKQESNQSMMNAGYQSPNDERTS